MFNNFQNKTFESNIKITHGEQKRKTLPLKFLILGEFNNAPNESYLSTREKINVTKNNINKVLSALSPNIEIGRASCRERV